MLTYDFEPLYRTVVGLDTLAHLLETMSPSGQALDGGPPYDIQSDGEDHYRITLNVAGFGCSDLAIETQENWLVVRGKKAAPEPESRYLYRGVAGDDFEQRFQLADFVTVTAANLSDGLLTIDLMRQLPEPLRPRRIPINRPKLSLAKKARRLLSGEQAA